jgi:LmbE family N-acetylglucosaminyl deacetylase
VLQRTLAGERVLLIKSEELEGLPKERPFAVKVHADKPVIAQQTRRGLEKDSHPASKSVMATFDIPLQQLIVRERKTDMRVLAIGAHPDDIELQCGGTLALYHEHGHEIFMAVSTNGDKGNFDVDPADLAAIREAEFRDSCETLGAAGIWMGYDDELLVNDLPGRLAYVDMIRSVNPDLVITHGPNDYHPDHRYTHQLVWDAITLAGVANVKTAHPATDRQVTLYFMDNLGGIEFHPTEFVDITETMEQKKKALAKHKSQLRIFRDLLDIDLSDVVETVGKFRGYQAGCKYAEGFTKVEAWYRGLSTRLLPVGGGESRFIYKTK